jgi:hypothetical protein
MEHHGFSSVLIKGITTSAAKAAVLYSPKIMKNRELGTENRESGTQNRE